MIGFQDNIVHAEHHHDDKAAKPFAMGAQEIQRIVAPLRREPIVAVGHVGPLGKLTRQGADGKTDKSRDADHEAEDEKQVTVAAHPAVGLVIGAKVSRDRVG